MKPLAVFFHAFKACLVTLGVAAGAFALLVSGPPKAYEVEAFREALGSTYVQMLERVEFGAQRLRDRLA